MGTYGFKIFHKIQVFDFSIVLILFWQVKQINPEQIEFFSSADGINYDLNHSVKEAVQQAESTKIYNYIKEFSPSCFNFSLLGFPVSGSQLRNL